jgi:hypothetical protein
LKDYKPTFFFSEDSGMPLPEVFAKEIARMDGKHVHNDGNKWFQKQIL